MDFEPVSDDHAIEEVIFGCNLSRSVTPMDMRALFDLHSQFSEELPAASLENDGSGRLQFAYLRPNGTPTWSLQVFDNNIVVVCTRYSRWAKVWATSRRYLATALGAIQDIDKTEVLGFTLSVTDRFKSNKDKSQSSTLLRKNDWTMPAALGIDGAWHNHVGWFDEGVPGWKILNHLNIDCRHGAQSRGSSDFVTKDISIRHYQQCRLQNPLKIYEVLREKSEVLDFMPASLHRQNKAVLDKILTEEMKSRINLQGEA
jgi:uncharacterized protein (TIGR04255 family)